MKANLLHLSETPILKQLQIEEALLRNSSENWIILNSGSPPAIVLGISGNIEKLIDQRTLANSPIPLIRRFSGGGTVVIDPNTVFVTLIFQADTIAIPPYPVPIMKWTENLYRPLFGKDFTLQENDYCYGERKFGGNAQSITRGRWLHHTSFLWDFSKELMQYLLPPERQPAYRKKRKHSDFLMTLSEKFSTKKELENLFLQLFSQQFTLNNGKEKVEIALSSPHRKSTVQHFNQPKTTIDLFRNWNKI